MSAAPAVRDRFSQSDVADVTRALDSKETVRRREIGRLVQTLTRVRAIALTIGLLSIWILAAFDALRWPGYLVGLATVVFVPIAIFDWVRLERGGSYVLSSIPLDIAFGGLLQVSVIVMTGGIESPLLPVLAALSFAGGAVLERPAHRVGLLIAVWTTLGILASAAAFEWWPRTSPPFLLLEPGFGTTPRYVVAVALSMAFVATALWRLGRIVARTVDRMLDDVIGARQAAFSALADRNRELVELSGAIAHELKNPLASVQGLVQLIERGGKNSAKRFEVLRRELDRTRSVLDEFLNFSRPLGELTLEHVEPAKLFSSLAGIHEGMAAEKGVVIAAPPDANGVTVEADPRKLGQALTNLLMNAIDASAEGDTVRWVLDGDENGVTLGVTDDGPGMSGAILARASEVGATTKPHGSGIGLAVARTIAEQHGGRLELTNLEPHGLRAVLVLPRVQRPERADG